MMEKYDYSVTRLPDIEMYGGDTAPWEINLLDANGHRYTYQSLSGHSCVFSIQQYAVSAGRGQGANMIAPIIKKTIDIASDDPVDYVRVNIPFTQEDTLTLRGKYVYQIEIIGGDNNTVYQGWLHVIQNINAG